jgi:serine/threonine protein kinase
LTLLGDRRYRVDAFLGYGGMGTVYRGTQLSLEREVAIKVLSSQLAGDEQFIRRFRREAATLATLHHPHIVTVYDTGSEAGLHYIVMAYIAGPDGLPLTLRQVMNNGLLERDFALRVIFQTCAGLQYAHEKGIIHRDIKPENLLLDAEGNVHLADFGIARATSGLPGALTLTASGAVIGTLRYMAPEQKVNAAHGDARSDLYALGVVLYEMLTGQAPEGRFELPSEVRKDLNRRIDRIVERALHRAVERRYQTAAEMAQDLSTLTGVRNATPALIPSQKTQVVGPRATQSSVQVPESSKNLKRRQTYGIVGSLLVLALLVGGYWYHLRQPIEEIPQQATEPQERAGLPIQGQGTDQQAETEQSPLAGQEQQEIGEPGRAEVAQQVTELLEKAKTQKAAKLLTTPAGDNAVETYQEVLRIAPGHEEALAGMREVKEQYINLAEAAKERGEWTKAQGHYEAALKIDPQDETLTTALQQMKEAQKESATLAGLYAAISRTPVLKEPRKGAPVVARLSPNTKVNVVGGIGDYLRVKPKKKGNPPGYIARKDVARVQGEPEIAGERQQATGEKVSPTPEIGKKTDRFIKYDNGTALDTRTGLMWMTKDFHTIEGREPKNWNDAIEWANKMNRESYGGYNDWRVPTVAEYQAVIGSFSNLQLFEQRVRPGRGGYWSSDKVNTNLLSKTLLGPGVMAVRISGESIAVHENGRVDSVRLVRSGR